jgi:intracellular sulfur oxidation DsrE/DsrF family protein
MDRQTPPPSERRSFLTRLNAGVASLAALAVGGTAMAQSKSTAHWEPARHEKDDWLDELPGKHRVVFDTITPEGLGEALLFAGNFINVNRADYGLQNSDLAVVIILRYQSVGFAYSDAIWSKYGKMIAARAGFEDPRTKLAPKTNLYNSGEYGNLLKNRGMTLDLLAKQGVQFAVCSVATRAMGQSIADATGGKADSIYSELVSGLVSHGRMVPAGIVAVNRAQERGYSLVAA